MTGLHTVELRGCTPEPLMAYLKALGIFRLVAEQADADARACWQNDTFLLRSTLDRDALRTFLLEEYRPTPIVSPWNSSSSITSESEYENLQRVLALELPRFQLWNEVVSIGRSIFSESRDRGSGERKEWVLAQCRIRFPDDALDWLDATYVLTSGGARFPPLLGTGGNDGRLEFSRNFLQNVVLALNLDDRRNGDEIARDQLTAALFDEGSPRLEKRTNGFFNPGSVGGANSSTGFSGDALTNPWDYVLMFEGALLFAGAAARRLSAQSRSKAVFPFTVDNSASGYGTSSGAEYGQSSRAEFWAPIWESPAGLNELTHLVSEGRAQLGRRQAATGTDFARAIAGLGAERGVRQFQRYGFLVRNGLAYLAAPLGRFHIPKDGRGAAERADVLFDLDSWMNDLRRYASGSSAPAGLLTCVGRIERAIIEFCQRGQPVDLQYILVAVGHAERWMAKSGMADNVRPLYSLSRDWLQHADDGSPEFRLARSLASILPRLVDGQERVGAVRENLEPVKLHPRLDWNGGSASFVWKGGSPLSGMLSVLERRCLEERMHARAHPPLDSTYSARLNDISDFLNGAVDTQRVADLALPLSFIRYTHRRRDGESGQRPQFHAPPGLPSAYATMKLTLLPRRFECPEFRADTDIWHEPRMLSLLRAGRVEDAHRVADRRLRSSGLQPLTDSPGIPDRSDRGRLLAAALLFPLNETANMALAECALRPPADRHPAGSE